jgi:hypothetical protein
MKKVLVSLAVLATASAAFAATPYTGPWTYTWNFDNGLQGWTTTGAAAWNGAGANGTGTIYAPDTSYAQFDATLLNLGGLQSAGRRPFVFQADVFVGATNYLQGSGIAAARAGDGKGPWATGTAAGNQGIAGNDKSWFNSTKNKSWGLAVGQWTTLQIDYGVTTPGKFVVGYTACPGNAAGWPAGSWAYAIDTANNADVHPSELFQYLRLGGGVNGAQTGWSQAQFDNVKLFVVPEPATLAFLALGFVVVRRRR